MRQFGQKALRTRHQGWVCSNSQN